MEIILNNGEKEVKVSKISIVIPIHNRERFLLRTLQSVKNQTYRPLQLILVDNNSSDSSLSICNDFREKNNSESFEIIITSETKKGANAARNKGLSYVTSEFVSFYDSDDEMYPYKMATIAQTIKENPWADIIGITYYITFPDRTVKQRSKVFSNRLNKHILTGYLSTMAMIVRTDLIRKVGGWNESLFRWQDWELSTRLLMKTNEVKWIKKPPLDNCIMHEESISGTGFSASYKEISHTINVVAHILQKSDLKNKSQLLLSVWFKKLIVAGDLYLEGEKEISKQWLAEILSNIPAKKRWLFKLSYNYKIKGGRGVWRLFSLLNLK